MIHPMMSVLVKEPFDREGWLFEPKWDGYRAIAEIKGEKVHLYSRNQKLFNQVYPSIVADLEKLKVKSAILDGELVVAGKDSFQTMQNYQRTGKGKVLYCVFDLLELNGQDLRKLSLIERKKLLKTLNFKGTHIRHTPSVKGKGIAYFKKAEKKGLEGIMGKDGQSPYRMKRSSDWVKIKTHARQEVVIGGFTKPEGSRKNFGALLLGVYEKGSLRFIGKVGTGFSEETLSSMSKKLKPLEQEKCPFSATPKLEATWVKPKLVCEVAFAEWTRDGKLRQPRFKGLRVDKAAKSVKRERPKNG